MAKINNKSKYPFDINLSLDDFVIGSDAENADFTRNYKLSGVFATFKNSLNLASIEYIFSDGTDPEMDESDRGYFTTNSNETSAPAVTAININKQDTAGLDITSMLEVVDAQPTSFVLRLFKPSVTGQVFYFAISDIIDNADDTYTLVVSNFVGANSLQDGTTYGFVFDLAGVPSIYSETDPIFLASPAGSITSTQVSNWDTAFGWGNHADAGYQDSLIGTGLVKSTAGTISYITDNSTNWDTAFGWGNHADVGYLTSYTETDPVFSASPAGGITTILINQWTTAYGWGDHSIQGYLTTETDPVFSASVAANITSNQVNQWNAAYSWGNHASVGYELQSNKGIAGGYVPLNGSGIIDQSYLPSYVDDVLEYPDLGSFPVTGETGKIYIDLSNNQLYRWSGSTYVEVSGTAPTVWGTITGTLSNQTDLQSAFDGKVDVSGDIMTGTLTFNNAGNSGILRGSDNQRMLIGGGSNWSSTSGAYITIEGLDYGGTGLGGNINFALPSGKTFTVNSQTVWHSGNLTPSDYVLKSGDTMTGSLFVSGGTQITLDSGTAFGKVSYKRNVSTVDYESYLTVNGGSGAAIWQWLNGSGDNTYLEQNSLGVRYYDGVQNQTVWHSGNDGAGSGLGADTVDGRHSNQLFLNQLGESSDLDNATIRAGSYSWSSSTLNIPNGGYGTLLTFVNNGGDYDGTNNWLNQLGMGTDMNIYFRQKINATPFDPWVKLWHSGNDGAGSGLDADLLDGVSWGNVNTNIVTSGQIQTTGNEVQIQGSSPRVQFLETGAGGSDWNVLVDVNNFAIRRNGTSTGALTLFNTGGGQLEGNFTATGGITANTNGVAIGNNVTMPSGGIFVHNNNSSRDKIRVYGSTLYTIGMESAHGFGSLGDWAMTFQMNNDLDRGFWWGHDAHTTSQGAMSLTTDGRLTVASYMRLGYGESDTTAAGTTYRLQVNGDIQASDFVLSSDQKLKKNVEDLVFDKPMSVRWREFDRIDGNKKQLGVIAQELRETHPEFVIEDESGLLSVKYIDLLIAKMAEKDKQVEDLNDRVQRLELILEKLL